MTDRWRRAALRSDVVSNVERLELCMESSRGSLSREVEEEPDDVVIVVQLRDHSLGHVGNRVDVLRADRDSNAQSCHSAIVASWTVTISIGGRSVGSRIRLATLVGARAAFHTWLVL